MLAKPYTRVEDHAVYVFGENVRTDLDAKRGTTLVAGVVVVSGRRHVPALGVPIAHATRGRVWGANSGIALPVCLVGDAAAATPAGMAQWVVAGCHTRCVWLWQKHNVRYCRGRKDERRGEENNIFFCL